MQLTFPDSPDGHRLELYLFVGLALLALIPALLLMIFYVKHVHRSNLSAAKKVFWIGFILYGNIVTMPIYYYLYFFRERRSG